MKEEEFNEIIKPLSMLPIAHGDFLTKALRGNFAKWRESKAENLPISDVRLSLPDNQEVEKESECLIAKYQKVNDTLGLGFRAGAKWMRDEIVNRNGSEA